jgi:hypothetical protein
LERGDSRCDLLAVQQNLDVERVARITVIYRPTAESARWLEAVDRPATPDFGLSTDGRGDDLKPIRFKKKLMLFSPVRAALGTSLACPADRIVAVGTYR